MKRLLTVCLAIVLIVSCVFVRAPYPAAKAEGDSPSGEFDAAGGAVWPVPLTEEDTLLLFSRLSGTPLTAAAGAGAWEGRLTVGADGRFSGTYQDADAEMLYRVTFSGSFSRVAEAHGHTYWLWGEEMNTLEAPGTRGTDEYGDPVTYTDPPFRAQSYMVLTLPGTPDSEIPETVQGEIGGTLDEWTDYSGFYTLTRQSDGWGFFAAAGEQGGAPDSYEPDIPSAGWAGIWQNRRTESRLYIFREEGGAGAYRTLQTMEKDGVIRAFRGSLYVVDEITMDYDSPGLLHAGIVGDLSRGLLSLTPFSAVDEQILPWMEVIEGDYEYMESLDDPALKIDQALWDLAETGLDPAAEPAPGTPDVTEAPAEPAPAEAPASAELSAWIGYWMTRDDSLAEMIITDNGNGTLHARAMFLPAGDSEATLTPREDGSMHFGDQYGNLTGFMFSRPDGTLALTITGGSTMEDEEATEYQGYYARGFTFYPAAYEEMWYQTPEDAAGTDDDWLGDWMAVTANGTSTLHIDREGGNLVWNIMLGPYLFSGTLEKNTDTVADLYSEDFFGMLVLNRKLRKIAMMEVGSGIEGVYDWMSGNTWYGVVVYRQTPGVTFQIPERDMQSPDGTAGVLPGAVPPAQDAVTLLPIPGKTGFMQVPVSRVSATSYISGPKYPTTYAPERMLDGEENTSFQFSTKTTPLGQAYLYFDFEGPVTLDEMWIKNGFWKITDGLDQYTRNSRIRRMTVFVRYAGGEGYQALTEAVLEDDPVRKDWKVIDMPGAQNVTGVRIRVDDIYTGSKFPNDVCVSEIMFVRNEGSSR